MSQINTPVAGLTTTGATPATGALVLPKSPQDPFVMVSVFPAGTGLAYTGASIQINGSPDYDIALGAGGSGTPHYANVAAQDMTTPGPGLTGTITLTNSTTRLFMIPALGLQAVQLYIQGISTGAVGVNMISSPVGQFPFSLNSNAPGTTLPLVNYVTGTTTTTFTAAEATGGQLVVYNSTATTPGSIATPTAAAMFAAQPGAAVGQQWIWRIINSSGSANTMTITADASVTLSGTTTYTIAEFAYRDFLLTFTSPTAATMKAICGGSAATN